LFARALRGRANIFRLMEKYEEAEADLRQALAIAEAGSEPTSMGRANIASDLALTLQYLGGLEESEQLLDQVEAAFAGAEKNREVVLSQALFYRSRLARRQGDEAAAQRYLDQAIRLRSSVKPENDGQLLYLQAAREQSRDLLQTALDNGYPTHMVDYDIDF